STGGMVRQGTRHAARRRQAGGAEGALTEAQILASIPAPAMLMRGGRIVAVNAIAVRLFAWSEQELLGHPDPFAFVAPEDRDRIRQRQEAGLLHEARTSDVEAR